ncbi:MAG: ABC transporter permease subunit, partial [Deltaproteobacteria bacterium]|nr:ABC transporter permease subunit [Deltaproteobacteria bacterium]
MIFIHPTNRKRLIQFKKIKRGYYSLILIFLLVFAALFFELLINNRAVVVSYNGNLYFPTYSDIKPGKTFGLDYHYETNYRQLKESFNNSPNNWLMMPLIPYNPYENDFSLKGNPPNPPDYRSLHLLGTDNSGRDILARLLYGFRVAIFFSFALYVFNSIFGIFVGCLMGYFSGKFDIIMQRIVEVWTSIPILYLIIIMAALITPSPIMLLAILIFAGWTDMTWLMRAEVYREKSRQYCEAARSMGAGHLRIIVKHLLPNSMVPIIARFPFQMVGGIGALTSLDYLGYGLPIPTPSWGELLNQGQKTFDYAPWILLSPAV